MAAQSSQYQQRELPPHPPQYHHQQQQQQQQPRQSQPQQSYHQQQQPAQPSNEPLSTSQHQRQHSYQKPTHKPRTFSFHSDKSHKSGNSKSELYETSAQKEAKRLHSKADPTLAISEAEPAEIAAMSESSLGSIRSIQHKDTSGNPIADPDKSNPTRSRWERPLDTIRSFEAAIDGGYNRKSMIRADTDSVTNWNRRSSYQPGSQPRYQQNSYYGSRPVSHFGMGAVGGPSTARNSYHDDQGYEGGYSGPHPHGYNGGPSRQRPIRVNTEPPNVYHLPHKDRSYETVSSAAGTGNSDQVGYQTDPTSSDNSSIERKSPARKTVNDYGIGFNQSQSYQAPNLTVGAGLRGGHPLPPTPGGGPYQGMQPGVPRKQVGSTLKRQTTAPPVQQPTPAAEKRKSWFSRRFSKNS